MKLNDIKSGYLVELSNGELYMKMRSGDFNPILISQSDSVIELNKYGGQEDLTDEGFAGYITKVYGLPKDPRASLMFSTEGRDVLYEYVKQEPKEETNCEDIQENKDGSHYIRFSFNDEYIYLSTMCDIIDMVKAVELLKDQINSYYEQE